jgi:AcrR family transcriptional regulator
MNTKEKIIYESLNLFSTKGFEAISVRDIANAVGIKASSLYNHFKNKQDIFDTIIGRYSRHITKFFEHIKIDTNQDEIIINKVNWVCNDQFSKKSLAIFKFYLEDEYIVKFRKLLTIEQFNNSKMATLYNKIFIDDILTFQSKIFEILINSNILVKKDPYTLAIQFYSPVFLMFYKYQTISDIELIYLRNHISEFKDTYTMKG